MYLPNEKKKSRTYAIVCIRMLWNRCNALRYHICRLSPFPDIIPTEPREKYINELTSENSLKLDWIDENAVWYYIFGMVFEKIRLTHVRLFGGSASVSASDSSSSLSLNVPSCCVEFLFRLHKRAIDPYVDICSIRITHCHAWEALNRPKIQLWNGFTSIHQNENWLLDGWHRAQ